MLVPEQVGVASLKSTAAVVLNLQTTEINGERWENLSLIQNALTDKVDDRELFMKGIDYSYYYEEE